MSGPPHRMALFAEVVQRSSFSEAARRFGLSKGTVSKQIAALERDLGVRLLNRTTRRLAPTEAGQEYFESCNRIVIEIEEVERRLAKLQHQPLGLLRVTGPTYLGAIWLLPAVLAFKRRYPELKIDLTLEDEYVDLVAEEVDVAIRVGRLGDSSLVVRKLARVEQVVCAAPAYLQRAGTPRTPQELTGHDWVVYQHAQGGDRVHLSREGRVHNVRVAGTFRTNSATAVRAALLEGMCIGMTPEFVVADALRDGRLKAVLPGYERAELAVSAVYPHSRDVTAKVRLFVDFLQREAPFDLLSQPERRSR